MNAPVTPPAVPPYQHAPLFPHGPDATPYCGLDGPDANGSGVGVETSGGREMLVVNRYASPELPHHDCACAGKAK